MQQPQSTVVNTAAHQVTLCCSDLCLRCVCDRWRERGLTFWSGSRQTHENGPYSKFRTGITTFFFFSCFYGLFLYTVLDKFETSTFSRLHMCSSNFVMLCPRHGWYFLWYVEVSLGKYWTLYFPWCFHYCVTLWVKVKVQRSKFCMIGESATRQDKLMKTSVSLSSRLRFSLDFKGAASLHSLKTVLHIQGFLLHGN